jgi:hypothetical protein
MQTLRTTPTSGQASSYSQQQATQEHWLLKWLVNWQLSKRSLQDITAAVVDVIHMLQCICALLEAAASC